MKKIILIGGKARSGKDTLATYLKEKLEADGNVVVVDMFAKYLKGYCRQIGWDGETKNEYWRGVWQKLGSDEIKEKLNYTSFHARRLSEDFQIMSDFFKVDYFIVSDTRYRDEIYTMKAMFPDDVMSVNVIRLGLKSDLTTEQLKHKSENDLNDFNYDYRIIVQDGIQHLYDEADRVLGKVLGYKE